MPAPSASPAPPRNSPLAGIGFTLAGYFALSLFSALNKSVQGRHIPVTEVMFFDGLTGMACIVAVSAWQRDLKGLVMRHWLQAVLMAVNVLAAFLIFQAYPVLPLVSVYLIGYTGPLMVVVLGALFLKERITWRQGAAILAGFAGVVFALGPGRAGFSGAAAGGALKMFGGTVLFSVAQILVRRLSARESLWSFPFYFYIGMFCVSGLLFHADFILPQGVGLWTMCLMIGVLDALSLSLMYLGLKYAAAGVVAPFQYSSLLWVALLDMALWSKYPAPRTWLGAAVVVAAGVYLVLQTRRAARGPAAGEAGTP